jgi:hemophore-related protein
MLNSSLKKLVAVAVGGVALSLTAGIPVATAALNTENPALAQKFNANPIAAAMLGNFLSSPPGERAQLVAEYQSTSWGQKYFGPMASIANSCNNY